MRQRTVQMVPTQLSGRRDELNALKHLIQRKPGQLFLQRSSYMFREQQVVINAARSILHKNEVQLHQLYGRLGGKPKEMAAHKRNELDQLTRLLDLYCGRLLKGQKVWLDHQHALMRIVSPQNIMKKGFAIVSKGDRIIVRAEEIQPGDEITVTLEQTDITSTVNRKSENHGKYDV